MKNLKRLSWMALSALAPGLLTLPANAELLLYDGFAVPSEYTAGETIDGLEGGFGFTGPWEVDISSGEENTGRYLARSEGMAFSDGAENLEAEEGSLQLAAVGSGKALLRRSFPEQSGEIWFSFLTVMTTDSNWNWAIGFEDATQGEQIALQNYSSSSVFRIHVDGTSQVLDGVDPFDDPADGFEPVLVVGRILGAGSGEANGSVEVWLNPADLSDLTAGAEANGSVAGESIPALSSMFFDKGAAPEGYLDEVRVGTSYADVVTSGEPEPESIYDGFATAGPYTDGETINGLDGGSGFTGPWEVDLSSNEENDERYTASGEALNYSDGSDDLATSLGTLRLVARGSGKALLRRTFPEQSGEVWFSFLTVMTTDSNWNWAIGLEDAAQGQQIALQNYSSSSVFRIHVDGTSQVLNGVDPFDDPADGVTPALVVGRILNAGSGEADGSVEVWINPSDLTDLSAGAEANGMVAEQTLPSLSSFFFDKGAAPEGYLDEVRIGSSYEAVVPTGEAPVPIDEEPTVVEFDFSSDGSNSISALESEGWDFSNDQGTAEIMPVGGQTLFSQSLVIGGDAAEPPRVAYTFEEPLGEGAVEFIGFTRNSFSQARVSLASESGEELFSFFMIAPDKVAIEAGSGGLEETVIPEGGSNDMLNGVVGYSRFTASWAGDSIAWTWQHFLVDGTLNHEVSGESATFQASGTPASLVLHTSKHDNAQRQFGISNLRIANTVDGLEEEAPGGEPPSRDVEITTSMGAGADTFVQAGKTLDRGARSYLASQRYSEVGPDDKALRQIYLRFDLSEVSDPRAIEQAAIELTIQASNDPALMPEFSIYGLQDDAEGQDWDELNMPFESEGEIPPGSSLDYETDNNINPETTTLLGTVEWGGSPGDIVSFYETGLVEFLRNDTDGLVTLILQWTEAVPYDGTDNDRLQFASRENNDIAFSPPTLVLELEGETTDPGEEDGRDDLTPEQQADFDSLRAELAETYRDGGSETVVEGYLEDLEAEGSFSDIEYSGSGSWEDHVARLSVMTQVYLGNSDLGGDAALLDSIVTSLDWWLTEDYIDSNWWWTYIGYPKRLTPIASLLGETLENEAPETFQKLIRYFYRVHDHMLVNPHGGGANLADMSYNALIGALMDYNLTRLESIIENGFEPVLQVLPSTSLADGLRVDGTIYSHGPQLYNATYGHELLNSSLDGIALLRGSPWDLGDEAVAYIEKVLLDGARNMTYGNWFDFNTMGRAVSRVGSHMLGTSFINDINAVLDLEPSDPEALEALLEKFQFNGRTDDGRDVRTTSFWYGDFVTHQRPEFYTSVRMVSSRTEYNESGNGEGLHHRYFGDGINFVLVDGDEYDSIQPLWNYERLPGLTAEQNYTTRPENDWGVRGKADYAGSVTDGQAAVAAMRQDHDGVTGWKSWFLFDDVIVALGSEINAPDTNLPIYTTLNQSIANTEVAYSNNGTPGSLGVGGSAFVTGDSWVWQDDIGYIIPDGNDMAFFTVHSSTKDWSTVGTQSGEVTKDVFTLWLNHGTRPFEKGYHYMILPAADAEETALYAADPQVEIISNTEDLAAVHDESGNRTGAAFLRPGATLPMMNGTEIQADSAVLLLVEKAGSTYTLTVADPSHSLEHVNLKVNRNFEGEGSAPQEGTDGTVLQIVLPEGDYTGAPVTAEFVDTDDPAGPWVDYFGDVSYYDAAGDFQSERFGWFNADMWPWLWSYAYEDFWYVYEDIPVESGFYWYVTSSDSVVFTSDVFFPWYYNYPTDEWLQF